MLDRKQKYEIVSNGLEEEVEVYAKNEKRICTSLCIWLTIRTFLIISLYLAPSISLTFYQGWLFRVNKFHFPLTVVLVHLFVKYILASIIRSYMNCKQIALRNALGWSDYIYAVAPPGVFSGIDIGFSNFGLELVTVSLYTMTKSTSIIFILAFALVFKLEEKSWSLCLIVIMIAMGLFLFTYEATQFNFGGFIMLIFASVISGLRWNCVQILMQKSRIGMKNPVDMIYYMQPWMIVSLLPFVIAIEGPKLSANCRTFRFTEYAVPLETIGGILIGASLGFILEFSEVLVVSYTSSLTFSVVGIGKEILIVCLAVMFNGDQMSPINVLGLLLCLAGIASHLLHKLQKSRISSTEHEFRQRRYNVEDIVLTDAAAAECENVSISSTSDGEISDSQVLFDILKRHDR